MKALPFIALILIAFPVVGQVTTVRGDRVQYVVDQDARGQVVTRGRQQNSGGPSEFVYLGSAFLSYPIWQPGSLVFSNQTRLAALISYNLVYDRISCQLPDSTQYLSVEPDQFTVNQQRFIRFPTRNGRTYYQVLYEGKVRLLKHYQSHLFNRIVQGGAYGGLTEFSGEYKTDVDFYLQRGASPPEFLPLTKKALLKLLGNHRTQLDAFIKNDKLTEATVVDALMYYDSLAERNPLIE